MKRRFVIAASPLTSSQSTRVTELFRSKYWWWHWIDGFWLVIDRNDTLRAKTIRDQIEMIAPDARILVLDVTDPIKWAGRGPAAPDRNMFDWIRNVWQGD